MASSYDDDEIIDEVDLFLSTPEAGSSVHIFQYPLRNPAAGIGQDRCITDVRIRPKHGRVEVKLSVLPNVEGAEEDIAASFDLQQEELHKKNIGHEQVLRSRPNSGNAEANFGLAQYIPAENSTTGEAMFVMAPVQSVAQLRPVFDYVDNHDLEVFKSKMQMRAARAKARGEDAEENGNGNEIEDVSMTFLKRESERGAERRKNSYATLKKKEEDEPWVVMKFRKEDECEETKKNLFENRMYVKREGPHVANTTYTDMYYEHTQHIRKGLVAKANSTADEERMPSRAIKMLPTENAVAHVLKHARVIGFRDLLRMVGDKPVNEVLSAARKAGMCLRGCWVARKARVAGTSRDRRFEDRLDMSRVLVLNLYRLKMVVTEKMAEDALGEKMLISHTRLRDILAEVAEWERGKGWVFRWEHDQGFEVQYGKVVEEQNAEWDMRVSQAKEVLRRMTW